MTSSKKNASKTTARRSAPRRRRNRKRGLRQTQGMRVLSPYLSLVSNPCHSELLPGLYGSSQGLLARLKTTSNCTAGVGGVNGFVLWAPDFVNSGAPLDAGNILCFCSPDSAARPANVSTAPFAAGNDWVIGANGFSLPDPAYSLLNGDTARDARTLSACMKMTFYGRLTNSSGQIAFLDNSSISNLLVGGPLALIPSVDDWFRSSNDVRRMGIDTLEHVWRPTPASEIFRDTADDCLTIGTSAASVEGEASRVNPTTLFGFAWRGVASTDTNLAFEFIKNIEWRPEVSSGLTTLGIHSSGPSHVATTLAVLDHHDPSWTHRVVQSIEGSAGAVVRAAYTGVSAVGRGVGNAIGSMAPGLLAAGAERYMGSYGALALL
jgi:hypothetical protein